MMDIDSTGLSEVEANRRALEDNIVKLRTSLEHWQTWELEYETLKEDLQLLGGSDVELQAKLNALLDNDDAQVEQITVLLDRKEKSSLFRDGSGHFRSIAGILGMLNRRIEYVESNIRSVSSSLDRTRKELVRTDDTPDDDKSTEEALPITEIFEELDENDNIISGSISTTEHKERQVMEVLKSVESSRITMSTVSRNLNETEGASSTNEVKAEDDKVVPDIKATPPLLQRTSSEHEVESVAEAMEARPANVEEGNHSDYDLADVVIPKDEPAEAAALRRQMLEYNMNEIGAVVAELNLDENDYDDEETHSDIDFDDTDDEDAEDEHGLNNITHVMTEDYLKEMRALEAKLQARGLINVGQLSTAVDHASSSGVTTSKVMSNSEKNARLMNNPKESSKAKGVRFADDLDVQSFERTAPVRNTPIQREDMIKEPRIASMKQTLPSSNVPFAEEDGASATAPGTERARSKLPINAANVIERPFDPRARRVEPDELDAALVNREITDAYHKTRNRMISQEGGFGNPDNRAEVPLEESGIQGVKKMSRFRAARLGMR